MPNRPLILFYNSFFGNTPHIALLPAEEQRNFTCDVSLFAEADAVVFHTPSLGPIKSLRKPAGQIWVLLCMESSVNCPCIADPSFLRFFDLTMTYERKADVWMPYFQEQSEWDGLANAPVPAKTQAAPATMFQSATTDRSGRIKFAKELMRHVTVDSYGKILNNKTLSVSDQWRTTKMATIASYKFCLALENSIVDDYVTEKFYDPLIVGTVPVYLGAPNVETLAPGDNCYINVRDFANTRELGEYLNHLNNDDAAYRKFFEWRENPLRQTFQNDLDRRGMDLSNLLRVVRGRMASQGESQSAPVGELTMSLNPVAANYGLSHRKIHARLFHALSSSVKGCLEKVGV